MRKYSVIIPLGICGLFHVNITEVIVEVEAKLCGASYGPREREGGGEREKEIERKSEHQLNFSKTKQHNFMYKNITHKDFDTCKPYDYIYTLTTYYLVLS